MTVIAESRKTKTHTYFSVQLDAIDRILKEERDTIMDLIKDGFSSQQLADILEEAERFNGGMESLL